MDIGIFSMENNSWLFASSYLSFCSQTWIRLCHLSSIFHQEFPPSKRSTQITWEECTNSTMLLHTTA